MGSSPVRLILPTSDRTFENPPASILVSRRGVGLEEGTPLIGKTKVKPNNPHRPSAYQIRILKGENGGRGRDRTGDPLLAKIGRTKNQALTRSATKCYKLLQVLRSKALVFGVFHSVAFGRVWWWAQNWAQSRRTCDLR